MPITIDDMQRHDWREVRAIYAEGLATGLASFRLKPPIWRDWDRAQLPLGRTVARAQSGAILGWAALAPAPDT